MQLKELKNYNYLFVEFAQIITRLRDTLISFIYLFLKFLLFKMIVKDQNLQDNKTQVDESTALK